MDVIKENFDNFVKYIMCGDGIENPYPNEHSCRLREPEDFKKGEYRRKDCHRKSNGKCIDYIFAELKDSDKWEVQALRYPKEIWTESAARAHCTEREGILFEPASS